MRNAFVIPSEIAAPLIEREKLIGICEWLLYHLLDPVFKNIYINKKIKSLS